MLIDTSLLHRLSSRLEVNGSKITFVKFICQITVYAMNDAQYDTNVLKNDKKPYRMFIILAH